MPRPVRPEPSDKQLELYEYILVYVQEHLYQPSQSEMAIHFGVTKTAIHSRLQELEKRGMISLPRTPQQRAITIHFVRCRTYQVDEHGRPVPRRRRDNAEPE